MEILVNIGSIAIACWLIHKAAKGIGLPVVNWLAVALVIYALLDLKNATIGACLIIFFTFWGWFIHVAENSSKSYWD